MKNIDCFAGDGSKFMGKLSGKSKSGRTCVTPCKLLPIPGRNKVVMFCNTNDPKKRIDDCDVPSCEDCDQGEDFQRFVFLFLNQYCIGLQFGSYFLNSYSPRKMCTFNHPPSRSNTSLPINQKLIILHRFYSTCQHLKVICTFLTLGLRIIHIYSRH